MRDIFDKLTKKIGANVTRIQAHVLFHKEDTEGEICDVLVEFADGTAFEMACAGDGQISVRHRHVARGLPPDIEEGKVRLDVYGILHSVTRSTTVIVLRVGGHQFEVENVGDEIAIGVNGKDISSGLRSRVHM